MDVSGFSHKAVFQPGTHCISKLVLILWIFFFFLSLLLRVTVRDVVGKGSHLLES